jgi:hypothetical protein
MKYSFDNEDYGTGMYTTSQIIYTPTTSGTYYVEATGCSDDGLGYVNCRIAITPNV